MLHNAKKRAITLILTITIAISLASHAAAEGSYRDWKQSDPRWGSVVLSSQTMKKVGCLATTVAILAVHAGLVSEADFDPGVFAESMKQAGGFSGDDDLVWEAIPAAVPGLTAENPRARLEGSEAEKLAMLGGYLDRGYLVAVAVRNGGHWVALRSVKDGRAVMMDPGSAATDLFAKYPAAGVTRAALLRAEAPKRAAQRPRATLPSLPSLLAAEQCAALENAFGLLRGAAELVWRIVRWVLACGRQA